ncbi:hybrid sensor histidine kinase/response regulator [Deltaproteobacteria bacterium Smac51]|nr:hybrid sensor histidine kinase/response regulator [Deltaproteobacteria bacterium Smac51]
MVSIKQAGSHLLSVINDVLDFSKIESGKLELLSSHYTFDSLINDVISIIRIRVMEKPIIFTANIDRNIPRKLVGDEIRLRQILLNVLGNAVKYTEEGFISFSVTGQVDEDNKTVDLTIEVADSGVGIKDEHQDTLFDAFTQVEMNTRRGIEGTGLGLAITKNLCMAMGGDIGLESVYGQGSTFTIRLPQEFHEREPLVTIEEPEGKNILLYETRKRLAESIAQSCRNLGVACTVVSSQSDFTAKLIESDYAFVFVSALLLEGALIALNRLHLESKLVVLTEYGANVDTKNYLNVPLPVYSIVLNNILNNMYDCPLSEKGGAGFIAPEARILITDDIETNLKVAVGLMEPYKMRLDTARSGPETIALVQKHHYDIVFLDHMMPEMDGLEATKIIRGIASGNDYFKKLPIVALTANVAFGAREMFLENGIDDFLAKPIEISKLGSVLDKWLPPEMKLPVEAAAAKEIETSLEIKGLDVVRGIMQTGGSQSGYLKVLRTYLAETRKMKDKIKLCLRENNIDIFTRYVHSIKSSSGSIGAADIFEEAQALEKAGNDMDVKYIRANIEHFLSGLSRLLGNLSVALADSEEEASQAAPKNGEDRTVVRELLMSLKSALTSLDLSLADKITNKLQDVAGGGELYKALDEVSDYILTSCFEEAEHKIDELLGRTEMP